ncbi:DUF5676 family membrane protein [Neptunomonas phycophila]|jgi:hypothetical protein|uniref:DUF5676 family membrane protein n=1 Tax=Neptunomonas phycophila TaxID=1572645 RepID=UPI0035142F54
MKFGIASAISASVLWIICSVLVMLLPSLMLSISGDMLHMQLNNMGWYLTVIGAVKGLVAWFVLAGLDAGCHLQPLAEQGFVINGQRIFLRSRTVGTECWQLI